MAAPHLLALPRELRDLIYSYLHQEVTISWPCRNFLDLGYSIDALDVEIHNAPLRSLLLTHSQLHTEYTQTWTHALSATIAMKLIGCVVESHTDPEGKDKTPPILRHLRHLTLFVHVLISPPDTPQATRPVWDDIRALATALPRLDALRVALQNPEVGQPVNHNDIHQPEFMLAYGQATRMRFMPVPPLRLACLELVQRGEGYRVMHGTCVPLSRSWQTHLFLPFIEGGPGDPYMLFHLVNRVGIYGFARRGGESAPLTCEDVVKHWVVDEYPEEVLRLLDEEEGEEVRKWPVEVKEWKEVRGREVVVWEDGVQ